MININRRMFVIAVLVSCFFISGCENSMQEVRDLGRKKIGQEVAEDIESYMSEDAKVKAKLTAPLMLRTDLDTPVVEFPKSLFVEFYDDSTNVESRLFARYGKYLENSGKVLLRDSVIVYNEKGDTLTTNELWWDRDKEIFYTDKEVLIRQPLNQQFIGKNGMQADQTFKKWQLFNASGVRNVPDSTLPG